VSKIGVTDEIVIENPD